MQRPQATPANTGPWASDTILNAVADGIHVVDREGRITFANPAGAALLGYGAGELLGRPFHSLVDGCRPDGTIRPAPTCLVAKRLRNGEGCHGEPILRRKDGSEVSVECTTKPLCLEARAVGGVLTVRDITAHRRAEAALADRAFHDSLTGLPNRLLLTDRFKQAARAARRAHSKFAVLMLDLDGFKQVNDRLGHLAGDDILREIAERLTRALREVDTVARVGGDEFVLLVGMAPGSESAEAVARRALQALADPMPAGEETIHMRASIGIALFPDDGSDIDTLLSRADHAMYQAKHRGGGYCLFTSPSQCRRGPAQLR